MHGETNYENTVMLMEHLERLVSEPFYDALAEDWQLTEKDRAYERIKWALED